MKIIPSRQYATESKTCFALFHTRRLMLFVLKIKINYIYLHQSPLKKFSFCTISFSSQKRASLLVFLLFCCGRLVMCLVEKWSIRFSKEPSFDRQRGIWNWHAKVLVMWRVFCWATLHLSGSIKDFFLFSFTKRFLTPFGIIVRCYRF